MGDSVTNKPTLTEDIKKRQNVIMFADDVVGCAIEKPVLQLKLEVVGSHGEETIEWFKSKGRYMCLNGTSLGSVNLQSVQLPQVTEFNYCYAPYRTTDTCIQK